MLFTITGAASSSASTTVAIGSAVDTAGPPAATPVPAIECIDDLEVIFSGAGNTGGTLDVYIQDSPDNTTFTDYAHFAQVAAAHAAQVQAFGASRQSNGTIVAVGQGLTPALAASTIRGGAIGRYLRVVATSGSSTSAGATVTVTIVAHGRPR